MRWSYDADRGGFDEKAVVEPGPGGFLFLHHVLRLPGHRDLEPPESLVFEFADLGCGLARRLASVPTRLD